MKFALLAVMLAGCAEAPPPPPTVVAPVEVQTCPATTKPPLPPRIPRTIEQVVAWAVKVQRAWYLTDRALAQCAASVEQR